MKFALRFLIISAFFLIAQIVLAQTSINAGFVSGLWYSKIPFFAGDEVRIYTVVQNQSGFDIKGAIQFFVGDKLLGRSDFSAVNGRLIEKWADWKVTQGEHNIIVRISDVKKLEIGKEPAAVNLIENNFISKKYLVDIDTDKDGAGNEDDLDDDGDGISDEDEIKAGTNPLVFNEKAVLKEIKEKSQDTNRDKNIKTDNKLETGKEFAAGVVEKTTGIATAVLDKTTAMIKKTKEVLEEKREKVNSELIREEKEKSLEKELPQIDKDKNPFMAALVGNMPALKEVYRFLLDALIFILNSWWLLLGALCFLIWLLWKMTKRRFRSERF
ncbi:MAG: hypothetical protein KAV41_01130 [Candidatus Pacebacteria bacterium]|nr:hypothetical protein [Candidatus Paceibacterota bacterium]